MEKILTTDQQRLVAEDMELARQLAWKFGRSIMSDRHEKCINMDDLQMEAVLGIIEAAKRFDSALGVEFSTLAFIWCRKFVLRAVRKYGTPLSVPDNFSEGVELLHLDVAMDDVANSFADCDDDGSPADRLQLAMSGLTPKEQKVLSCLYGLEDGKEMSGAETATELGVVPGRVSQIKQVALRKLELLLAA